MLDIITVPTTVTTDVNKLLKIYLENGTVELLRTSNKSEKFFNVGFLTKYLGGNTNNSSIGLKALDIIYTRGNAVKHTNKIINM